MEDNLKPGDIVRFVRIINPDDIHARMLVIEVNENRVRVIDCKFLDNPEYSIKPVNCYPLNELIKVYSCKN